MGFEGFYGFPIRSFRFKSPKTIICDWEKTDIAVELGFFGEGVVADYTVDFHCPKESHYIRKDAS